MLKQGIEVDEEFYTKDTIKNMLFNDFKMFVAFLDVEDLQKAARWHSEDAEMHVQELMRTLK